MGIKNLMSKWKYRIVVSLFTIVLVWTMLPQIGGMKSVEAGTGIYQTDEEIQAKILELITLIGDTYFNVGHHATDCTTVRESGHGCWRCQLSNVMTTDWFKAYFGNVSLDVIPSHAGGSVDGQSCYGFANFAEWYIFKTSNSDKVTTRWIDTVSFSYENIKNIVRPGDVLRFGTINNGHSVIVYSVSSSNIRVIDCNWQPPNYNCMVQIHNIDYSGYYGGWSTQIYRAAAVEPSPVITETNPGSPFPIPTRNLSIGCEGMDVCWVQKACNAFMGSWMTIDGVYDSGTAYFVRLFQEAHGLEADGIAGPLTVGKMKSLWPAYEPVGDLWGAECSSPGKIHVWGYGFDEDALDQAINIKIYIWAAEGNNDSESDVQIIKAKSQHEVYGHTGPYYYEETITTKAKGDVYVVAYGMNIGGGNAEAFFGRKNISITPKVDVSSVSLDKTSISLKEEETATLKATVSPSNATSPNVTWSSNKTSVATVSSTGVVTAVSTGQATITATADGKSATCTVNVTPKVNVYKVTLDAGDGKVIVNGPDASCEHASPWVIEVPEGSSVKSATTGNWYGTDDDVYTQIGWVDQDKNEYLMDENGLYPSLENLVPTKDMTLTPIWTFYPTVSIDWNGGEYYSGRGWLSGCFEIKYKSHDDLSFDDDGISRDGYVFGGWLVISGTNKGTVYTNQQLKTIYSPTENSSIMAIWTEEPVKQGWKTENGKKYYYKDGTKLTGFQLIGKAYYVFDTNGVMQTGWYTLDGKTYYMAEDGVVQRGTKIIDGKTFYFDQKGVKQDGWVVIKDNKYYFDTENGLLTGLKKIDGDYYYFSSKGVMYTGWLKNKGKTLYFKEDGKLAKGLITIDGKKYYFASNGVMTTGWFKSKGKTYYFNTNGVMQTGWKKIGGYYYGFNSKGVMQTGWIKYKKKWYYLQDDGKMLINGTLTFGPKTYIFDENGVCTNP